MRDADSNFRRSDDGRQIHADSRVGEDDQNGEDAHKYLRSSYTDDLMPNLFRKIIVLIWHLPFAGMTKKGGSIRTEPSEQVGIGRRQFLLDGVDARQCVGCVAVGQRPAEIVA